MKHFKLLLWLFALLAGLYSTEAVGATDVENYSYEFSTTWGTNLNNTTANRFKFSYPGKGWGRQYISGTQQSYTYNSATANNHASADGGTAVNGCMMNSGINTNTGDYIVTPLVKGHVSLWAKRYLASTTTNRGYNAYVKFYKMNATKNASGTITAYTVADTTPIAELSLATYYSGTTATWGNISCDLDDYTYIGIQTSYCYIDDFTADNARIEATVNDALLCTVATNLNGNYDDADANGDVTIKFTMTLKNDGDLPLINKPLNVRVINYTTKDVISTIPLTLNLKAGRNQQYGSATEPLTAKFNIEDYPDAADYYIWFQYNGQTVERRIGTRLITPTPYKAVAKVTADANNSTIVYNDNRKVRFQPDTYARTLSLRVLNNGAAPLNISNVTCPAGFTTTLTSGTQVAAHGYKSFTIKREDGLGMKQGTFTFQTNDPDHPTYTWNLEAEVTDNYVLNFESNSNFPINVVRTGATWTTSTWGRSWCYDDNNALMSHYAADDGAKVILPLLQVASGDVLSFDATRYNNNKPVPPTSSLKVLYSTDRLSWTEAKTITSADLPTSCINIGTEAYPQNYYDWKTFTLEGLPAGNYYIAFQGDSICVDNIFGKVGYKEVAQSRDMAFLSYSMPDASAVNSVFTAKARVYNATTSVLPASDYTVKLYFNDEVVAQATSVEMSAATMTSAGISVSDAYASPAKDFSLNYTVKKAGTYQVYIEVKHVDGYTIKTPAQTVVVAEENGNMSWSLGQDTSTYLQSQGGITQSAYSEAEYIYPEELVRLKPGTKIKSLKLRGQVSYAGMSGIYQPNKGRVMVYIGSTTDSEYTTPYAFADRNEMSKVYDNPNWTAVSDHSASNSNKSDYMTLIDADLAIPYEYTGGNLRVVLVSERTQLGGSALYFMDNRYTRHGIYRGSSSAATATANPYLASNGLPVIDIEIEAEPSVVSGTVTEKSTGAPVAGYDILLTSNEDDVEYQAVTDAQGKYSINVFQDGRNFHMRAERMNYYPQDYDLDVNRSVQKDLAVEGAVAIYPEAITISLPDGNTNSVYTAEVDGLNMTSQNYTANDYVAKLYVGGEAVATAPSVAIASTQKAHFTFSYIPHVAGTYPAYIAFEHTSGLTGKSDVKNIEIKGENVANTYEVGDSTTMTASIGVYLYTRPTHTETFYTAAQMAAAGFQVGDEIRSLSFHGGTNANPWTFGPMRVYVGNTDVTAPTWTNYTTFTLTDASTLTKVYEGSQEVKNTGLWNKSEEIFKFEFDEPFVYDGRNLVLVVESENTASTSNIWFVGSSTNTYAVYAYQYNANSTTYDRAYKAGQIKSFFEADRFKTLSGTVSAQGDDGLVPAEGVAVTLKSNTEDVVYYATTDAQGQYSIRLGRFDLDYTLSFRSDKYDPADVENVSMAEGDQQVDITLMPSVDYRIIEGVVTDINTSAAIAEAKVVLSYGDQKNYSMLTDENGKFSYNIREVEEDYSLTISKYGYEEEQVAVTIAAGQLVNTVNVALTPIASRLLEGTVTNSLTNEPVAGASVKLTSGDLAYSATTLDNGSYTVAVAEYTNDWNVSYTASGYEPSETKVNLTDGDKVIDVALDPILSRTLSGKVIDKAGNKVLSGVAVSAVSGDVELTAVTDENGLYTIDVEQYNLDYTVTFTLDNYLPYTAQVNLAEGDVKQDAALEFIESYNVSGTVTESTTGEAVEGVAVKLLYSGTVAYETTTDAQGQYSVDVPAYNYLLDYTITFSKEDYEGSEASLSFNGEDQQINAQVTKIVSRTFSGVVVESTAYRYLAGVSVQLKSGSKKLKATTDAEGRFAIKVDDWKLDYTATFTLEGYEDAEPMKVSLVEGDKDIEVVLTKIPEPEPTSIAAIQANDNVKVYNLHGQLINKKGMKPGLYIVNGKKTVVK